MLIVIKIIKHIPSLTVKITAIKDVNELLLKWASGVWKILDLVTMVGYDFFFVLDWSS